jgi:hypothetical protein
VLLAVPAALALAACGSSSGDASPSTTAATTAAGASTTVATSAGPAGPTTTVPLETFMVQLYSLGFGVQVTPEEATCLAGQIGGDHRSELETYVRGGAEPSAAVKEKTMGALVHCEPSSFVQQAVTNITKSTGATAEQATCVVKAVDDLAEADPEILTLAASGQNAAAWPDSAQTKFVTAISPSCVTGDIAQKLLAG